VEICKSVGKKGNMIHEIEHAYLCKLTLKLNQDTDSPCSELHIQGKHSTPIKVEVYL